MAVTFKTQYPAELTNAAWQKAKGKLDKLTKTGLGPLLDEAQRAWGAINFNLLNEKKQTYDISNLLESSTARYQEAQQHLAGPVNTANLALLQASRKARDIAQKKKLSKPAVAAATTLSNALQKQAALLKSIKLTDYDKYILELKRSNAAQTGLYQKGLEKVTNKVKGLAGDPTLAGWNKANLVNDTAEVRSQVYGAIQVGRKDFQPFKAAWVKITSLTGQLDGVVKGADPAADQKAIKKYVKDVQTLLNTVKL